MKEQGVKVNYVVLGSIQLIRDILIIFAIVRFFLLTQGNWSLYTW